MSVTLYKLFVNTIRLSLPRLTLTSAGPYRTLSAMETVSEEHNTSSIDERVSNKNFTRFRKRRWEESLPKSDSNEINKDNSKGEDDSKGGDNSVKKTERIKRKKVAMLLGYCGVDYYGMQRNPGVRTIEEDLLKALLEAKYITEEDFANQQNAHFQRSSRTDKGVSAARQIVSLKLPLDISIEEINKGLPECIRVFGVKRVTNKFNSKIKCNARTYSYTLPTFVLEPSAVDEEQRKQYRVSKDKLEQLQTVLDYYKGTKNYHNFTEKKHFLDASSSRYMLGFTIDKVFVESDTEFAELLVKGQSFMLHQIRKMVGLAIAVVRGHTDKSIMDKVFSKDKVMIPTAPGLGLVLDKVHYDRYDARYKSSHDTLTWEAEEELIQKFKREHIFPNIVKGEIEGNSMSQWLEKLNLHSYEPSEDTGDKQETEIGTAEDLDDGIDEDDDDDEKTTNTNSFAESVEDTEKNINDKTSIEKDSV